MLVMKALFIFLPLIALASGQRDRRFRWPSRLPPRVVPRPVSHPTEPTTLAPTPVTTTEKLPHVTVTSTRWPSVSFTHSPPTRVPSHHSQPNIVWSKPFPTSSTPKPTVTVIVLPGDDSHSLPTTPTSRPHYVYPARPSSIPVDIPIAHESEPLYSKPKPEYLQEPEHKVSISPKPTAVAPESEPTPSSPKAEIVQPSTEVSSSTEAESSKPSEITAEIKPASEAQPEITSTPQSSPTPQLKPLPEPQVKPNHKLQSEISPVPEATPASEPSRKPEAASALETSSQPEASALSEVSPPPEYSLPHEPKPEVTSERLDESSASPAEFEPKVQSSPKPVSEYKPSKFSLEPEADAKAVSEPSRVSSKLPASESQSEDEVRSKYNIKFKYIPGIGKSRNPTSASWTKPSWYPKPSTEHTYPGTPTPKPSFHLTSRSLRVSPPIESSSSLKPFSEHLPTARTPSDAFDIFGLMDYHCHEPYGYFAVPTMCDAYIECKANRARQINCPDGLHFNPKSVWPEYPCSYPSEVKCADNYEKQAPKPTAECPRQYGYFQSPSGNCGEYIMCLEGKATEMFCPSGLAFNLATTACDWPANVPSCSPDVFKGFTCPVPEVDKDGNRSDIITNKYRFEKSCKKYIACQRGSPRLLSCDEGFFFDDASQSCIDDEFVKDCS